VKVLQETCTFLWLALESPELSHKAKEIFSDPYNEVFLSVVSAWESVLKYHLRRLPLAEAPQDPIPQYRERLQVESLPLNEEGALYGSRLPELHRDPFDRMLICQSIVEGLTILTPDQDIRQYPVRTLW
jgi:PIN domain nuclease of toxin-antitoxin system